jgi:iron complex outermembrane recepter protein
MRKVIQAVLAAAAASTVVTAAAQDAERAPQGVEHEYKLQIDRLPITEALTDFSEQTGVYVSYVSQPKRQSSVLVGPLQGRYTVESALDQITAGTGLTYKRVNATTVAIVANDTPIKLARFDAAQPSDPVGRARSATVQPEAREKILEVVVVTAQKREERLIDVPVSISMIGAEEVERRALVDREDYMRSVPSVALREDGVGLAEIVIRGAYADRFNSGPTVGLYFGDVPLTGYALGGSTDIKLIDIERVEVLRGPQGTLYGSNALSGAIRYIAKEPDLQGVSGNVHVDYSQTSGNGGNNAAVNGVLNLPLVDDQLAIRAVAFRHDNDGYVKNVAGEDAAFQAAAALVGASHLAINEEHVGGTESTGGRLSALWKPTDAISLNLTYFTQKDSQDDRLFELRQYGAYRRADYQFGDVVGGNEDALVVDVDIVNLTGEIDLGWGSLYSSSAWLDQEFIRKWDIGSLLGRPTTPIPQINQTEADVFAQELRFTSKFDGPFDFVLGLYYEDSATPSQQSTHFGGDPAFNPFPATQLWRVALDRQVEQRAVFGELSYDILDSLQLTVGGRAFEYESRFWTRFFDSTIPTIIPNSFSDLSTEESGDTGKVGLEFKPTNDALIYASWSQGFRLGQPLSSELLRSLCDRDSDGFLDGTSISSTRDRIDSDRLDSYELGGKVGFMDGRASVQVDVYQNDWSDVPVSFIAPGCLQRTTVNGGSARARGVEAEGRFTFFDTLRLSFGFGYVDSELTATTLLGAEGDRMNFTPEYNGNLGLEYGFNLFSRTAFVRGDYTYFGSYYTGTGERGFRADSYGLVNLRGGIHVFNRGELQLRIDNALNSDAFTAVIGPSGFPPGYGVRLMPRTFGVGLSYDF